MAITTTIAPSYAIRMNIIAVVCVALGVWGLLDFTVIIPRQWEDYHRYEVFEAVKDTLEAAPQVSSNDAAYPEQVRDTLQLISERLTELLTGQAETLGFDLPAPGTPEGSTWYGLLFVHTFGDEQAQEAAIGSVEADPEQVERARRLVEALGESGELERFKRLVAFDLGLRSALPGRSLAAPAAFAYELATGSLKKIGSLKQPGKYDRLIKGALFFPCLPLAPYIWWLLVKAARRKYRLDDDGSLHAPEGDWPAEEIADIDMNRWMAKSTAHAVITDGARIKLDDYLYRNMHLIVGALAARFYPEEWTADAKPIKPGEDDEAEPEPLPDPEDEGEPAPAEAPEDADETGEESHTA